MVNYTMKLKIIFILVRKIGLPHPQWLMPAYDDFCFTLSSDWNLSTFSTRSCLCNKKNQACKWN